MFEQAEGVCLEAEPLPSPTDTTEGKLQAVIHIGVDRIRHCKTRLLSKQNE